MLLRASKSPVERRRSTPRPEGKPGLRPDCPAALTCYFFLFLDENGNRRPVRILTTANHLDSAGGLERTHLTNARGLARRGHRLDLVYVEGGAFFDRLARHHGHHDADVPTTLPRRAQPVHSARTVVDAMRAARELEPDIVYAYRYWDLPFAVAVAAGRPDSRRLPPVPSATSTPAPLDAARAGAGWTPRSLSPSTPWAFGADTGLRTDRAIVALTSVDLETYDPATRRPGGDEAGARNRARGPDDLLRGPHRTRRRGSTCSSGLSGWSPKRLAVDVTSSSLGSAQRRRRPGRGGALRRGAARVWATGSP